MSFVSLEYEKIRDSIDQYIASIVQKLIPGAIINAYTPYSFAKRDFVIMVAATLKRYVGLKSVIVSDNKDIIGSLQVITPDEVNNTNTNDVDIIIYDIENISDEAKHEIEKIMSKSKFRAVINILDPKKEKNMKTRKELRDEELIEIGSNDIDVTTTGFVNVDDMTSRLKTYTFMIETIDRIISLKYATTKVSECIYTMYTCPDLKNGILYYSFIENLPEFVSLAETKSVIETRIIKLKEKISYWTTPIIDLEKLKREGKLFTQDSDGGFVGI